MKHNTKGPVINKVKNKATAAKIQSKRQDNFGYRSVADWEGLREQKKEEEDKKFENLAPFAPKLNDNFNAKCSKCQERGTGKDWIDKNTPTADEWVKIREKIVEDEIKYVEETCPFVPLLKPTLDIKLYK